MFYHSAYVFLLQQSCSSDEDMISEEEILQFKANETKLLQKREELRETLRQRFQHMQKHYCHSQSCKHKSNLDALAQKLYNLWSL